MKGKECEKHARNYTKILGIDFDKAIMYATHAAMFSQSDEPVKLRTYKAIVDLVEAIQSMAKGKQRFLPPCC